MDTLVQEIVQSDLGGCLLSTSSMSLIQTLEDVNVERAQLDDRYRYFDEACRGGLVPGGITLIEGEPGSVNRLLSSVGFKAGG